MLPRKSNRWRSARPASALRSRQARASAHRLAPCPVATDRQAKPAPDPFDDKMRVLRGNEEARVAPTREGYVKAIQVWPYADGALY